MDGNESAANKYLVGQQDAPASTPKQDLVGREDASAGAYNEVHREIKIHLGFKDITSQPSTIATAMETSVSRTFQSGRASHPLSTVLEDAVKEVLTAPALRELFNNSLPGWERHLVMYCMLANEKRRMPAGARTAKHPMAAYPIRGLVISTIVVFAVSCLNCLHISVLNLPRCKG